MVTTAAAGIDDLLKGFERINTMTEAEKEAAEKAHDEFEERKRRQARQTFLDQSGMDEQYYGARIDSPTFTGKHRNILLKYVEQFKNKSGLFLVILGEVGTGKTYSACAVMNELLCGTYLDMPELRLKLNTADRYGAKENREMFLHRLANCSLLVLDEVGRFAGKQDEEQEVLFYLLNKRYANKRPTIICSNLTAQEFSAYIGQALTDRLKGRNVKLILEGASLRGTEYERKQDD